MTNEDTNLVTQNRELSSRLQRAELKTQALLEKVSNLTTNYENQVADLRVEVTLLSSQLQEALRVSEDADVAEEEAEPTVSTD